MNTTTERTTSGNELVTTRVEPEWKLSLVALIVGILLGWSLHSNWSSTRREPEAPAKPTQTAPPPCAEPGNT